MKIWTQVTLNVRKISRNIQTPKKKVFWEGSWALVWKIDRQSVLKAQEKSLNMKIIFRKIQNSEILFFQNLIDQNSRSKSNSRKQTSKSPNSRRLYHFINVLQFPTWKEMKFYQLLISSTAAWFCDEGWILYEGAKYGDTENKCMKYFPEAWWKKSL